MQTKTQQLKSTGVTVAVVGAYLLFVLSVSQITAAEAWRAIEPDLQAGVALWVIAGLIAMAPGLARPLLSRRLTERPLSLLASALRHRWDEDFCISLLWPPIMFGLLVGAFGIFKQTALQTAGFRYDAALSGFDRNLFDGIDPWRLTHALPSPWTTMVLDRVYNGWFAPMSAGLIACAFVRKALVVRTQYMLSFAACWILIGSLAAYYLPASGPCYAGIFASNAADYRDLMATLHSEQAALGRVMPGFRLYSLQDQSYLLMLHQHHVVGVGGGISAMPSLHVAFAALFAAVAFRLGRIWGWLAVTYAGLIFVGSVHLGWHYAVDGLAGGSSAVAIWLATGKLVAIYLKHPLTLADPPGEGVLVNESMGPPV